MSDRDKVKSLILLSSLTMIFASARAEPKPPQDLENKQQELERVEDAAMQSRGRKHALESEVAELSHSRERLNQELLEATNKLRQMEHRASEIEARLETLLDREKIITQSLRPTAFGNCRNSCYLTTYGASSAASTSDAPSGYPRVFARGSSPRDNSPADARRSARLTK